MQSFNIRSVILFEISLAEKNVTYNHLVSQPPNQLALIEIFQPSFAYTYQSVANTYSVVTLRTPKWYKTVIWKIFKSQWLGHSLRYIHQIWCVTVWIDIGLPEVLTATSMSFDNIEGSVADWVKFQPWKRSALSECFLVSRSIIRIKDDQYQIDLQ